METDTDREITISCLRDSLAYHKELLEQVYNERDNCQLENEQKINEQEETFENWKVEAIDRLEQEEKKSSELEKIVKGLRNELEEKKEAYRQLEVNFYSHVKTIQVTDDDLSTVQSEISHLLNQLNNTCMSLKTKMDRKGGTQFVYRMFPDKIDFINRFMKPVDDLMDTSCISLFVEKYLIEILLTQVLDAPVHLGVSINEAFRELSDWMSERNRVWSDRLRQQVCALVVQKPGPEEERITKTKQELLTRIVDDLNDTYPLLKNDSKKLDNLLTRALKLSLATKGQEIKILRPLVQEGTTQFDPLTMKPTAKGKSEGLVGLVITPAFTAKDDTDDEHGFMISAKVFCIEQ